MNAYVDNVCMHEDGTNLPKQNVPPPLSFPYPKIYLIVVPKVISYANTSHFIVVFVDVVHAYKSQFLTLPVSTLKHSLSYINHINPSETKLVYCKGLVSYTLASISLVIFGYPFRNSDVDVPLVSICAFFDINSSCLMDVSSS